MSELTVPSAVVDPKDVYDVFFCHTPNSNFVFPNGQLAVFIGGRYATNDPNKAAYLQYEIDQGNPSIYRKPECLQVAKSDLAPDSDYRKRVIAEYLAEQAAAKANPKEMGDYEPGKLMPANTSTIASGAADSSSGASGAAVNGASAVSSTLAGIAASLSK